MLITFLVFGATLLPEGLDHVNVTFVTYAVLSLTVIRMIPIALSLLGSGIRLPTSLFLGWFGPRGLASILFVLLILEEFDISHRAEIFSNLHIQHPEVLDGFCLLGEGAEVEVDDALAVRSGVDIVQMYPLDTVDLGGRGRCGRLLRGMGDHAHQDQERYERVLPHRHRMVRKRRVVVPSVMVSPS